MNEEFGWSHATFEDWQAFQNAPSCFTFDKILDRDQLPLPDWFVPSAHGAVIPSRYYLSQRAGFNAQTYKPRGWRTLKRANGHDKGLVDHRYLTRRCGGLFSIERSQGRLRCYGSVLAHRFASTPVFTRTLEEAQYLAQLKRFPSELRWVTLLPYDDVKYTDDELVSFVTYLKLTR